MTRIVYSTQRRDFEPGVVYENPVYFQAINTEATSVVVIGDWPRVVEAYQAAGIEVSSDNLSGKKPKPVKPVDEDDDEDEPEVTLTAKWRQSSFKTLQRYVKKFDPDKQVKDRAEAIEFIEAHLPPEE